MKPVKYTKSDAKIIDLKTKVIHKYPTPTRVFDIGKMIVNGRNPEGNAYMLESDCDFVLYVIKGSGKVYAGDEVFEVSVDDVVFVPKGKKFAVEGELEYIDVDSPAFYPEQVTEVVAG
jgi:mannose-6-phosphate isomerase-like protein (cupin superfamily)